MESFNTQNVSPSSGRISVNNNLNENINEDISEEKLENIQQTEEINTISEEKLENIQQTEEINTISEEKLENIQHVDPGEINNGNYTYDDSNDVSDDNELPPLTPIEENFEPGNCPYAENCPIKIAIDNGIRPHDVRHDPSIREHINSYHSQLNFLFSSEYLSICRRINQLQNGYDIIRYVLGPTRILGGGINNIENEDTNYTESTCSICQENYDHNEFFMSCCATSYCTSCVQKLKTEEKNCPSCENKLEYLKDIKISSNSENKTDKNDEDCFICCEVMNSTQYNGKVKLECSCKMEICISCAYKSLQDSVHTKMDTVQGIPGLILPQTYKVKGSCPQCKQVPDNKDEIISLYGFLPPRM
jgi:hypothetical protein